MRMLNVLFLASGLFQEPRKVGWGLGIHIHFFPPRPGRAYRVNKRIVMGDSPPSREEAFLAAARLMRIEKCL